MSRRSTPKERVEKELEHLKVLYNKLETFIDKVDSAEVDHEQIVLMLKQSLVMESYIAILEKRLRIWKDTPEATPVETETT